MKGVGHLPVPIHVEGTQVSYSCYASYSDMLHKVFYNAYYIILFIYFY